MLVCREIHDHNPLEFDVLLRRYLDEMNHAICGMATHVIVRVEWHD